MAGKRPRHPDKDIEAAIEYAESKNWRVNKLSGHSWGELLCPYASRDGCRVFVSSTPRNRSSHARKLRRLVDNCDCKKPEEGDECEKS